MNTDSTVNQYFNKVFCGGWDFCISDQKAANRKHKNILQELEVLYIHVTNYSLIFQRPKISKFNLMLELNFNIVLTLMSYFRK